MHQKLICFLLLSTAALTGQTAPKLYYLTPGQVDSTVLLPSFPAKDSVASSQDLAKLHRLQESRTPVQIQHAQADDADESIFLFKDLLGSKFNREALPLTALLSDHVRADVNPAVRAAKQHFRRLRPHHFDPTIKPVCPAKPFNPTGTDFAYPGGHGTVGYTEALVLGLMLPQKRDAILARADDYAESRVVCGVHYPSDGPASKLVAYAVFGAIANHALFQKELAAAKAELRAALDLH